MKITREQLAKYESKMVNGWHFDLRGAMYGNEKQCVKDIDVSRKNNGNKVTLRCKLLWYRDRPCLHMSVYSHVSSGLMRTDGIGKWIAVGDSVTRKNFSILQKETGAWDDGILLKYAERYDLLKQAEYYLAGENEKASQEFGGVY